MEIQQANGIVLSSKDIGESDILSTILTREYGKRTFIFKGLKKSKRRSKTASEPGTHLDFLYYFHENRNTYIVNEFNVRNHYLAIRNDLNKIYHFLFILETVEKTIGENHHEPYIYDLLCAGLDTLSKTQHVHLLTPFFILHLLRSQGMLPQMNTCSICASPITGVFSFNIDDLKPVCSSCQKSSLMLNKTIMDFVRICLHNKFHMIQPFNFKINELLDLLFSLILYIEHHYQINLKSKQFVLDTG